MKALELIHDLYNGSAAADRCPHLQHDRAGCRCRIAQSRVVCDHFSLQLWCLAGPERWPVCIFFPPAPPPAAERSDTP